MKHHSAPIRLIGMAVRFGIWRFWTQWSFWILLIPTTNKMGKTDRYFQIFPIPITNKMGKSSYFALRFQVPVHVHKTCRPHPRVPLRMLDPQHLPVPELHRSLIRDPKIWDKKRVQKLASKVSFSMGSLPFPWKMDEIWWNPLKSRLQTPRICKNLNFPFPRQAFGHSVLRSLDVPWSRTVWVSASKAKLDPSEFRASRRLHSEVAWEIPTSPTPNAGQIMDIVCQYYDTHMVMISKYIKVKKHVNNCSHIIWNSFGIKKMWWYQYEHHLNDHNHGSSWIIYLSISIHISVLGHPNSSASLFSSAATAPGVMSSVRCSSTWRDDGHLEDLAIDKWEFATKNGDLSSKKMQTGWF